MKKLMMMIAAAVAVGAFADTTASYTVGDTSLANGKITFEYDGSDNITKMRMKPDYDETLTLTGAALSFADGAQLITSQQGTPVIANTVSAAGSLRLGSITNMTYQGGYDVLIWKNNTSWTTLFPNTHLDDISPVSAAKTGKHSTGVSIVSYPYWVVRENDTLRAEFQCADVAGNAVYAVWLEARQNGSNVEGRILRGGYKTSANNYTNYVGISMFEHDCIPGVLTTNNNTATEYGLSQITFGRRCDTFDYYGTLLTSDFDTVVATNVAIGDVELLYGANQSKPSQGWGTRVFEPRNITFAEGVLSAEFARYDSPNVKAVKVELKQFGDEIKARVKWARYATSDGIDFDFEADGAVYTTTKIATEDIYVSSGTLMYGIDTLCLRSKAKDNLTFKVNGTMDVSAVAGNDVAVTFEAASASATVNATAANTMTDSAYVIKGDAEHVMDFRATPESMAVVLPSTTDAYGANTVLHIRGYNKSGTGGSAGKSAITMHPGSKLITESKQAPFDPDESVVVLDNATMELATGTQNNNHLGYLTLSNASVVCGAKWLCAGYSCASPVYRVTGMGASTNECRIVLFTSGNDLTLDVEDTVAGAGVDFVMTNNVANDSTATSVLVKTGEGTMLMTGQFQNTANANRIVEGEICLGVSDAVASGGSFSLEGGTLGLAANTANTVSSVAVTADSAISFGAGATLTVTTLTLGNEVNTLSITGADGEYPIRISNRLDAETLAKIRLNGKRVIQAGDGRLVRQGLIISVF